MANVEIRTDVLRLQKFLILTNPLYVIRDPFKIGKDDSDYIGFTDNPIKLDSTIVLEDYREQLTQILDSILKNTNTTESFREFIYNRTLTKYLDTENNNLWDILEPFRILEYALFDAVRVKTLERFYIVKEGIYLYLRYKGKELDLFPDSGDIRFVRHIKKWINEYLCKYSQNYIYEDDNNQQLVVLETELETIIDESTILG